MLMPLIISSWNFNDLVFMSRLPLPCLAFLTGEEFIAVVSTSYTVLFFLIKGSLFFSLDFWLRVLIERSFVGILGLERGEEKLFKLVEFVKLSVFFVYGHWGNVPEFDGESSVGASLISRTVFTISLSSSTSDSLPCPWSSNFPSFDIFSWNSSIH